MRAIEDTYQALGSEARREFFREEDSVENQVKRARSGGNKPVITPEERRRKRNQQKRARKAARA